ncbi:MAG: class I SAM-dependent methyltransferase [Thermoguttaceae bacterium]|nr:class I SAM-dependent methyltransferase [Thermoguttaceae bacterium]MDW8038610.1 class I SAM-dependent methyltransferase [Thermoguttaceae bacterium]
MSPETISLPCLELLAKQAEWLAPFRAGLLRRAAIAQRKSVLDLGCGPGLITAELLRRSGGRVVGLDRNFQALRQLASRYRAEASFQPAQPICADACRLPFADRSFDLVFCQWVLLWLPLEPTLSEIRRVLAPGGMLVALEPDYGGMIEYPSEIASAPLWQAALRRAGADPEVARKIPPLLAKLDFQVQVMLLDRLHGPDPTRWEILKELPLTAAELAHLQTAMQIETHLAGQTVLVHLPIFGILGKAPPER